MNMQELARLASARSGLHYVYILKVMKAIHKEIELAIERGEDVELKGMYSFRLVDNKYIDPNLDGRPRSKGAKRIKFVIGTRLRKAVGMIRNRDVIREEEKEKRKKPKQPGKSINLLDVL